MAKVQFRWVTESRHSYKVLKKQKQLRTAQKL